MGDILVYFEDWKVIDYYQIVIRANMETNSVRPRNSWLGMIQRD